MPACRTASPCSAHHRPTVPSVSRCGKRLVGKVAGHFVRRQVDVGKYHQSAGPLFEHLGSPAGLDAGIETLAAGEANRFEQFDQPGEMPAAAAIGVVIVVAPTEPQRILPGFLQSSGPIAAHPVVAFGSEEQVARPIDAKFGNGRFV